MRGINKRIIEITDTDNEAIEKILIIIKPGAKHIHLVEQKAVVEKYTSAILSYRRFPFLKNIHTVSLCFAIGITGLIAALVIML